MQRTTAIGKLDVIETRFDNMNLGFESDMQTFSQFAPADHNQNLSIMRLCSKSSQ